MGVFVFYMKDLGIIVDDKNSKSQHCYVTVKLENIIRRCCHRMIEFCP